MQTYQLLKRIIPTNTKRHVHHFLLQFGVTWALGHPYPEQFLIRMDCPKKKWAEKFVLIASTPRSGSHYLGHILGSTGECGVPLEYLNSANRAQWERRFNRNNMDDLFANFVYHRTTPNGVFALKAHWNQFEQYIDKLNDLTRGVGFSKVIWIIRRDQLAQSISLAIAHQTGVWISGAKPRAEARYEYDAIVNCAKSIRHSNLRWLQYVNSLSTEQSITVIYEDLLSNNNVLTKISKFLELNTALYPPSRMIKQRNNVNDQWKRRFIDDVKYDDLWIIDPPVWLKESCHNQPDK